MGVPLSKLLVMRRFEYYTFVLLIFMMLVSCNSREQYREQKMKESESKVDSLTEEVEEQEENLTLTQDEKQIPVKVNDMAFDLFRYIRGFQQEKSFVVSPLSLAYNMGMAANGASGKTLKQHEAVIGRNDIANSFFQKYARSLPKRKTAMIELLNVLAANKQYTLKKEFVDSLTNIYQAGALNVSFEDANAVNHIINDWFQQHAHGKVPTISIEPQPLDLIYLINYLHFKNHWSNPFNELRTELSEFKRAKKIVSVPLMNNRGGYLFFENPRFQALSMQYYDHNYRMLIVLPKTHNIGKFAYGFNHSDFDKLLDDMSYHNVEVFFPKFTTESNFDLINFVKRIVPSATDINAAEYGRLCDLPSYISKVRQIVKIEVSEKETEATAETISNHTLKGEGEVEKDVEAIFRADHPFLYFIYDDISRTILLMGQYCGD